MSGTALLRSGASAVVLGALALAVLQGQAPAAAGPQRLLVSADEFSLVLSRQRLRPGRAVVQLLNRGEDDHDLRLRRVPARRRPVGRSLAFPVTAPGALTERTVRLSPDRYRLWCSLPGHRALGMRATLRVPR